jgi:hypothetical protein
MPMQGSLHSASQRQGRDAAVEMTGYGEAGEADSFATLRNDSQKGKGKSKIQGSLHCASLRSR